MKILQVNCVYRKGSTGKIVYDIHTELQIRGIESVICYGRGDRMEEQNVYKFCSETEANISHLYANLGGLQYASAPFATWHLERIIIKEKPDIVHLHCINGFCVNIYQLLRFLAKSKIKTIVTHHAEFFYTGNCGHSLFCKKWMTNEGCNSCHDLRAATGSRTIDNTHRSWKLMREAFDSFDEDKLHFTAVSPWVVERSMMSNVLKRYPCTCVMNGVDTSVFHNVKDAMDTLQNKFPIGNKDFVLHVTAFFSTNEKSLKGGRYIVQLARMMPEQLFVVVASEVLDIDNLPSNILLWGRANGQKELAALYSVAKATVNSGLRKAAIRLNAFTHRADKPANGMYSIFALVRTICFGKSLASISSAFGVSQGFASLVVERLPKEGAMCFCSSRSMSDCCIFCILVNTFH